MNIIIDDFYNKYIECLSKNDRDICDVIYLNGYTPLIPKKHVEKQGDNKGWVFVNRGYNIKKN